MWLLENGVQGNESYTVNYKVAGKNRSALSVLCLFPYPYSRQFLDWLTIKTVQYLNVGMIST